MTAWRVAFTSHKRLLQLAVLYTLCVCVEAVYCGVPAAELLRAFRFAGTFLLTLMLFAAGIYAGAYCGLLLASGPQPFSRRVILSFERLEVLVARYATSPSFAYASLGALVLLGNCFFLVSKSLINTVNPLHAMKWDFAFSSLDRMLHGGYYPHEFILPAVNALGAGRVLDGIYFFWLNAIFLLTLYNLFCDKNPHRRLRFLWVYSLSWMLLGSVAATVFNSVGPLFYHYFYPAEPDVYGGITRNLENLRQHGFTFAVMTRVWLIRWQSNDTMIDPNAISAMPSMHVAIAWLAVLYARTVHRYFFWVSALFFALVLVGSVYLGFHYAIDGYISIVAVSVLWWAMGKYLDRHFTRTEILEDTQHGC